MKHTHGWLRGIVLSGGLATLLLLNGCGTQNEYLAEGKDALKSDKRNRVELAVEQFHQAISSSLTSHEEAETHYLLAYYDESLPLEERVTHFAQACDLQPRKYEEALLYETLRDRDETVRKAVRLALAQRYQSDPARIRRELFKALYGKDNRDRYDAAWVLGYLAAKDTSLVKEIVGAMNHKRMETRLNAVIAIEELARENPQEARQAVPILMEKIEAIPHRVWWKVWNPTGERESPEVRQLAVSVLGTMGATDQLLEILSNKGSSLRPNAMDALIQSGTSAAAIPVLLGLLEEETGQAAAWETQSSQGKRLVQLR